MEKIKEIKEMQNKKVNEKVSEWIIISIKTKCPKCGREYESIMEVAKSELDSSCVECINCGFHGTY